MQRVWRLILRELRTQDWRIWLVLPLPLIVFFGPVETLLGALPGAGPYAAAIVLTAYFVMLANNHRELVRKPDREPEDRPSAGHEALVAKYAMTFIWFILAAFACNVVGAAVAASHARAGPDRVRAVLLARVSGVETGRLILSPPRFAGFPN
ncbi:MAG: hypothetical protein A9Z00_09715 [Thermobacillus sp. ZCTH02-B1]|uniref:hypothetical protein n=1 Tax=Thermobacillus sp. ZCTH02-B1 TaxID=1858795 RepID=UPI000B576ADC|nr:hypothetical protein [Thermobacillus sp. ZCTH02-B1]OUM97535.1 MAG: hypothetical protein A9Z00_09715 [Thermobacillus sp. ZCTH02-B1]